MDYVLDYVLMQVKAVDVGTEYTQEPSKTIQLHIKQNMPPQKDNTINLGLILQHCLTLKHMLKTRYLT